MNKFVQSLTLIAMLIVSTVLLSNSSCEEEVILQNKENAQAEKAKKEIFNEVMSCQGRMVLDNSLDHNATVYIVKYDNCEYLVGTSSTKHSQGGTSIDIKHSASCRNPIHKTYEY